MKTHQNIQPSALFNEFPLELVDKVVELFIPAQGDSDASKNFYTFDTVNFKGSVKDATKTSFAYSDAKWKTSFLMLAEEGFNA